jgi:hypothetical protein
MPSDFAGLHLADGTITKLCLGDGDLRIFFCNWREEEQVFLFQEVLGVEAFGATNVDLSHGTVAQQDPFLERSCALAEESPDAFRCFAFFSAWSEDPILKIVARSFSIQQPQPEPPSTQGAERHGP